MFMHADSLFTSLGGIADSGINAFAAVTVENCIFKKAVALPGSRYIKAFDGGSVRMVGNTFEATTGMFEVSYRGILSAPNFLLGTALPNHLHNRSPAQHYTHTQSCTFISARCCEDMRGELPSDVCRPRQATWVVQ
jgi:hypothetical protein